MKINNAVTDLEVVRNSEIFYAQFKSSGEKSLCVNGSVTPAVYTLEDLSVDDFILTRVDFLISSGTALEISVFAGLPAELTNGIKFDIDGSTLFKNNADMIMFASSSTIVNAKVEGVALSMISGHWDVESSFQNGLVCTKDALKITVQDNLTTAGFFQITASGLKLS